MKKPQDPLDEALQEQEKVAAKRLEDDKQVWEAWKVDRTPEKMDALMGRFEPVFRAKAQMWKAPNVNQAAFLTNLRINAVDAFNTYDPNKAALRTHLETKLQRAKRFNIQHQNYAYMPDDQVSHIGRINQVRDELKEELGRDPNHAEIASRANRGLVGKKQLNQTQVKRIMDGQRKDVIGSTFDADPAPHAIQREREIISLLRPSLEGEQQTVYDYLYGKNGKPTVTSTTELARVLGKSPSQISRLRTAILKKFEEYK